MEVTIIKCDVCGKEIVPPETPFVIKTGQSNPKKQIGCDVVLTPRGNRFYSVVKESSLAMIRMNASFYCGSAPTNVRELHFHAICIEAEVRRRFLSIFRNDVGGIHDG